MSNSTPSPSSPRAVTQGIFYGLGLMALFALLAMLISATPLFAEQLRLSPLIISVVIGMIYANTYRHRQPTHWDKGLAYASKRILRLAIVFYAFRLTFTDIVMAGWAAFLYDCIIVSSVIIIGWFLGKLLRVDADTTVLTSAGSAICGAAAVLGTEPVLRAKPDKTVVAVATVVIFGTLSMFLYPGLYRAGVIDLTEHQMAVFTGGTLHEVAHVAGAGAVLGDGMSGTATITKMIRVILLAPFLLILSKAVAIRRKAHHPESVKKLPIPWFAIWFLAMIGVNTLLTYFADTHGLTEYYGHMLGWIKWLDDFGLCLAMAALGSDASVRKFRQAGIKPFALAGGLYLWLVFGGYILVKLMI